MLKLTSHIPSYGIASMELLLFSISSYLISETEAYALLDIRQDEKAKMIHRLDTLNIFAYVCILILIVCTIWLFKHKRVKFIHETGLAIIYGLIVGAIIKYIGTGTEISQMSVIPKNVTDITNSTLNQDAPPDMLWIEFNVPDINMLIRQHPVGTLNATTNTIIVTNQSSFLVSPHKNISYEPRSYAYVFQGEIYNPGHDLKPQNKKILDKATFDPEIFFNLILPLIVFNAGYSLKRKFFFRNFGAIMTYAFIGTTISCFAVGIVMKSLSFFMPETMKQFSFIDCLYFGAIISATDPVTVLAIFNDIRVDVTLHALVFGESILNDVISIVLASSIDSFSKHYNFGFFIAVYRAAVNFFYIFVWSLIQGSLIGCATALLTKHTKLCDQPLLESTLFVLMSYASFLLAEALELSGIVSVLFCGICQAHYTYNNLSQESRVRTKSLFDMCNFIAENFIFAYIGVSIFTFPQHLWSFWFILFTFVAIILGRALNIYPLSYFLNLGRHNKIPVEFQHVLFLSGLRGAMAFALAIRNTLTESRRLMLTSISLVSITSVIFCGSSIQPILQYFFIPTDVDEAAPSRPEEGLGGAESNTHNFSGFRRSDSVAGDLAVTPADDINIGQNSSSILINAAGKNVYEKAWLVRKWYNFDVNFMKPLLTHSRPSLMETIPCNCCMPIARFLTSKQQMSGDNYHQKLNDDDDSQNNSMLGASNNSEYSLHHRQQSNQQQQQQHPASTTSGLPYEINGTIAELSAGNFRRNNNHNNSNQNQSSTQQPNHPAILSMTNHLNNEISHGTQQILSLSSNQRNNNNNNNNNNNYDKRNYFDL